jgi:GNAT superfamily N-acetyltransferase
VAETATLAAIAVRPVATRRAKRIFIRFPWRIYRDDPSWVPPILAERAERLDPNKNPLFRTGVVAAFIAWKGHKPVGTIAAAIDPAANAYQGEQAAVFGFFECIEDYNVAQALLDQAAMWARAEGMQVLRGPQSFGSSDEPGVLIEGRETPRGLLMGWSPPYYQTFIERYGMHKYQDSLAYRVYLADYVDEAGAFHPPHGIDRIAEYVQRRYKGRCRVRLGDLQDLDGELEVARRIYNRSLGTLPLFTPESQEDWRRMASAIRPLLDPEFAPFVEVDGEPVAFGLALPDINQALLHCNGLRAPWDYLKLWWYSRHLPGISFKIMAMVPEYREQGLDALIYHHIAQTCFRKGYQWVDMSLTGDDNPMTNKMAQRMGAVVDKRYRVYELALREH